jgi:hypothetical protein
VTLGIDIASFSPAQLIMLRAMAEERNRNFSLEQRIYIEVGDRRFMLVSGDVSLAPKGVLYRFVVESPGRAHWITITRGHDFESMVKAVSQPAASEDLPPQTKPNLAEIVASMAQMSLVHH